MRIIKKETDYALRALFFIKERGGRAAISQIYSNIRAPRPFLRKILQLLARAGILYSSRGKNGGFEFKIPFEKISLAVLNEVFDERTPPGGCPFKNRICANYHTCSLKSKIAALENETYKRLEKTYIKDLWG
ncbi:MAG: Rrf2 family transcriptional regulator [Elusimicrobiota bacterium]